MGAPTLAVAIATCWEGKPRNRHSLPGKCRAGVWGRTGGTRLAPLDLQKTVRAEDVGSVLDLRGETSCQNACSLWSAFLETTLLPGGILCL